MSAERPLVLATDDSPEILRLIERTLARDYEIHLAADVPAARARLAELEIDLALCDIQMPGESGLDLAEEIITEHDHTAVVLVTGEDDQAVAERAFALGVHGYLVKPFWAGQLRITAMNALRRHALEMEARRRARELERRLQVLMDGAPIPIYMKDAARRYLVANRAAHEIWGIAPYGMIGRTTAEIVSTDAEAGIADADARVLSERSSLESEESFKIGGEERAFLTARFPYLDEDGEVGGICGISRDVTDARRAERLQAGLATAQRQAIEDLKASREETVERLSRAIELHDSDTGGHVQRMASVAAWLAEGCGLDPEQVELLRVAAPMHDVGKVGTPDSILEKPGALDPDERAVMERHTTIGHEILAGSRSDLLQLAATIALTHHERWDGDGYPQGLAGSEIPLAGRIVAVADVFDALLSDRAYRPAMPVEKARGLIAGGRGSQFDPEVVDLLLADFDRRVAARAEPG
jgi:PAS domain S-box-containing protein